MRMHALIRSSGRVRRRGAGVLETKRHMDAIKRSPEALVTYQAIASLGVVSDKIARRVRGYYADKVSVVLTNVPGPSQKLYFAGKLLETIVF